ncbi:MAG TPA: DUF3261 domain-containing protein, partial [Polyangiaceae bacterium LLY-WYZ-15_(1-7)]|nr:DUF3261 domain-containing protein [Polyangiaceae bacterium LLY-WYZ-15_(1-7)]
RLRPSRARARRPERARPLPVAVAPRIRYIVAMTRASLLAALLLAACGPRGGGPPPNAGEGPGYPTEMVDPASLEGDFAMEQEVTMRHPRGEDTFRAVLQKRGGELLLLGLAPHGGRAFLLRQDAEGVSFESYMPFELPFPPEYILHDVHRTWFLGSDGATVERDGERITERLEGGRVVERSFERLDGAPDGTITVRFGEGLAAGAPLSAEPPDEVVLENGWFGYTATIRTLSWQPL